MKGCFRLARPVPAVTVAAAALVICLIAGTAFPAAAVVSDDPAAAAKLRAGVGDVIIELTAAPAAKSAPGARAVATSAAAGQRRRLRQTITDVENRKLAGRGLGARSASSIVRREYGVVLNGFAARLSAETVAELRRHPEVARISADTPVHATLASSVPLVRAPLAWLDGGYRGAGMRIAVIDTGVQYTHADLGGCLGAGCKVIGGFDFVNGDADPMDDNGHGTHVASTAAGNGLYLGVAPDAQVLAYKVLDDQGNGSLSAVIAAIERAADPDGDNDPSDHADVISMSLGGTGDENDAGAVAVDNATAVGVLSVVAAGNEGPGYFTVGSPGASRTALTVGANNDLDQMAGFSSRGPTTVDFLVKPEITAPGVSICAGAPAGSFAGNECGDTTHFEISGTSMATPHVSGAAAIVRGLRPALAPDEVKALLQHAAVALGFDVVTGGSGRLDVRNALDIDTIVTPSPINLGVDNSPDPMWVPSTTLRVRNLSASDRSYSFTLQPGSLPTGASVSVTPNPLVVPAGTEGSALLTLTVDNQIVPNSTSAPHVHDGVLLVAQGAEEQPVIVSFAKGTASLVLVDPFTEFFEGEPFDLESSTTTFSPAGGSYDVCREPAFGFPTDPTGGTSLGLTDDSFAQVNLTGGAEVALFGTSYTSLFVGANGYVTFGSGDNTFVPSLAAHFDRPRISAVFSDLNPAVGGSITVKQVSDRIAVTFDQVPNFTTGLPSNFQIELFFDGTIRITHLEVNTEDAISGLSRGSGVPGDFVESNLSLAGICGTFGPDRLISGRSLRMRDAGGTRKRLYFVSTDAVVSPAAGGPADPRVNGAMLELFNPVLGEYDVYTLPANGWRGLGNPAGSLGFAYRDRKRVFGPCSSARLRAGKKLKASCKGSAILFTLDETAQGTLGVAFTTGSGPAAPRHCAVFGGQIKRDQVGRFVAKYAPAPSSCPMP